METIHGFKGFDKDFKCRGFQYKEGETYTEKEVVICEKGFHFCENPLDVLGYYPPADSRFAAVSGEGKSAKDDNDSKVACSKLHISAEITLPALLGAGVKFILAKIDWTNKKESNTGHRSAATNTGYGSAATVEGANSIACGLGYECKARGSVGCWIVLAERNDDGTIRSVKAIKADGKKIKADTFYKLVGGKFVEEG